jgi:hypothetical protein
MADKRNNKRSLAREGELSQTTRKGLEIPIPTREEFLWFLDKAAPKKETPEKPSQPGRE